MIEPLLLSKKDAARALAISTKTIDRLIAKGHLKPTRIGRKVLIHVRQIQRFSVGDHPRLEVQK